ncbi:NACHT domain-containing protein [Amycolatopsis japonica]|uniref:NACHT domain-containing protein n=1 Tax=Amycolatopsis japonica TaxID=208439 RepID=UPI0033341589
MTGVESAVLAKVAGVATESIIKRIRRVASDRGFGKGVASEITAQQLDMHRSGYWPASLASLLPSGLNQRDIEKFLTTPEFEAFTSQLVAGHLLSGRDMLRKRVREAIVEKTLSYFPPTALDGDRNQVVGYEELVKRYNEKLKNYAIKLSEHLDASCAAAAEIIEARSDSRAEAHAWGFREVAGDILGSIEEALDHLVRGRESLDWVERYRSRFSAYHSEITAPDVNVRMPVNYAKLFVGPTVLETDSLTLRPYDDLDGNRVSDSFQRFYRALDRAVLLGDPGAGKSTSSTVVALEVDREKKIVPFVVVLRELRGPEFYLPGYLADLLGRRYDILASAESIEKLLHEGGALIVFDGLDEVIDNADRLTLAKKIEVVSKAYPFAKILVTCRKVGYASAKLEKSFSLFSIGPFSEEQIEEYVTNWFNAQGNLSVEELSYVVHDFMTASAEMVDLTQNPLLLAFMCVLYRGVRSLPEDRAALYEKCVELLLGVRDKHFSIVADVPSISNTKTALSRVAHIEMRDQAYGLSEREISDDLINFLTKRVFHSSERAKYFVGEMLGWCRGRAWMFTDFGPDGSHKDLFTFTHASFREYFGALYFVRTSRDARGLVEHLFPLMEQGKSEVYSQVCCALFDDVILAGASEVVLGLVTMLEEKHPHPLLEFRKWQGEVGQDADDRPDGRKMEDRRRRTYRIRSVSSGYLAGIVNCLPALSSDAMGALVSLSVAQVTLGDSAAIARLLDPASKHHVSILEMLSEDLSSSISMTMDKSSTQRQVWFAIHAPYLLANVSSFAYTIKPKAVEALNDVVRTVGPYLKRYDGRFDIEYAMLIESGAADRDFAGIEAGQFCDVFTFLFNEYLMPIKGLGPPSVAVWIFDAFRSSRREVMPVARVVRFLRNFGKAISEHCDRLYDIPLPVHAKFLAIDFESMLRRIFGYSLECRVGLIFLIAAQVELNQRLDPMSKDGVSRNAVGEWAARMGITDLPAAWVRGEIDFWCPPGQEVA